MPDYNKGKIYTIRCTEDTALIYVGSTTQLLSQRWTDHKKGCNNEKSSMYHTKLFETIRKIGLEKFYIELYEDYPCESKENLLKREGEIIRQIATLNSKIEGRKWPEYYADNKEHRSQTHKEWYDKNREKVLKKVKDYCIENKEKLNEYRTSKCLCECGQYISYTHMSRHKQTKTHMDIMEGSNTKV